MHRDRVRGGEQGDPLIETGERQSVGAWVEEEVGGDGRIARGDSPPRTSLEPRGAREIDAQGEGNRGRKIRVELRDGVPLRELGRGARGECEGEDKGRQVEEVQPRRFGDGEIIADSIRVEISDVEAS